VEEPPVRQTDWAQLRKIVGLFHSGLTDVSERKEEYLAEAYYRCGRSEPPNQEGQS
jgi:hypothetical protein